MGVGISVRVRVRVGGFGLARLPGSVWNSTKRYEMLHRSCGSRESRSSIQNSSPGQGWNSGARVPVIGVGLFGFGFGFG